MSDKLSVVTDATFDSEVLQHRGLVLVDFWAEWCGPCKTMLPMVGEVAALYDGEVKVVKVNADDNRDAPARFNVRGLPTLVLFENGQEKERILGMTSKTRLTSIIDKHLPA